eukprot:1145695-Pelagomonas_calceolata.AAC.1
MAHMYRGSGNGRQNRSEALQIRTWMSGGSGNCKQWRTRRNGKEMVSRAPRSAGAYFVVQKSHSVFGFHSLASRFHMSESVLQLAMQASSLGNADARLHTNGTNIDALLHTNGTNADAWLHTNGTNADAWLHTSGTQQPGTAC